MARLMAALLVRIEGSDLPGSSCGPSPDVPEGYRDIRVGVQRKDRRDELLGVVAGDAPSATWTLECTAAPAGDGSVDVKGPYISGPPGGRFVYLSWVHGPEYQLFRRAKLLLAQVPAEVMARAVDTGVLVGRIGLTDAKGHPTCAASDVAWSAG